MSKFSSEFAETRFNALLDECDGDYWRAQAEDDDEFKMQMLYDGDEEWRRIKGFPDYEVSNLGRVRSWRPWRPNGHVPRILTQSISPKGYHYVSLFNDSGHVKKRVHRLVAEAFISNELGRTLVCHVNDNKDDNSIDNLYWGTPATNSFDSWANNTYVHKPVYCYETNTIYNDSAEAADALGVCRSSISMCCTGKSKYVNQDFHYHICYAADMDDWIPKIKEELGVVEYAQTN